MSTARNPSAVRIQIEPGKTQFYEIPADAVLEFGFEHDEMTYAIDGNDLIITSPDGGVAILMGYAIALAGEGDISIHLIDGDIVPGDVLLSSMGDGQFETAAAGGAQGSGQGDYMDDPGPLFGSLDALDSGPQDDGFMGGDGSTPGGFSDTFDDLSLLSATPDGGDTPVEPPYEMVTFDGYTTVGATIDFFLMLQGSAGDDTLVADGNILINGVGGDDLLIGDSGNNYLAGGIGDGSDTLWGGGGNDDVQGGPGNDLIYASTGHDYVHVDYGDDTIIVQANAFDTGSQLTVDGYEIGSDLIEFKGEVDLVGWGDSNPDPNVFGDIQFRAVSGGEEMLVTLEGVTQADFDAYVATADFDAHPADDLVQYMINPPAQEWG